MDCPDRPHQYFARATWRLADVAQQDLEPAYGTLQRDHRSFQRAERHYAMTVIGQSGVQEGPSLGVLSVRCERHQGWVLPLTLAIADVEGCQNIDHAMAAVQPAHGFGWREGGLT